MADKDNSIIDPKYRDKYKDPDWIGELINSNATDAVTKTVKSKDKDGNETEETVETKKRKLDLDRFFALCKANHIDTASMEEQVGRPNATGRIRMTLGNSLRAAARRRGGLFDNDGNWQDAPEAITKGAEPTENPDGSKIAKAKAEAEEAA